MKNDGCGIEKMTSMKDVYQRLLKQGYHATIDNDNSFITVVTGNGTVWGMMI